MHNKNEQQSNCLSVNKSGKKMKKKKVSSDFCQAFSKRFDANDNSLCWEACSIWFHIQCIKVPECVYDYV